VWRDIWRWFLAQVVVPRLCFLLGAIEEYLNPPPSPEEVEEITERILNPPERLVP